MPSVFLFAIAESKPLAIRIIPDFVSDRVIITRAVENKLRFPDYHSVTLYGFHRVRIAHFRDPHIRARRIDIQMLPDRRIVLFFHDLFFPSQLK